MNRNLFIRGLKELGLKLSDTQIGQFALYSARLREWNKKMNLTAIIDPDGIALKHFLDSLLPLKYIDIPQGAHLADIGTGAGFPGLPIKIARPDIKLTLIDSLGKRLVFLDAVINELGLADTELVHGRAEELGRQNEYREKFDIATSRAVADMTVLSEYCIPFVEPGGIFVALKAKDAEDEYNAARPMIGTLGGKIEDAVTAPLPESDMVRTVITVRKIKPTPTAFPRSTKKIKTAKQNRAEK